MHDHGHPVTRPVPQATQEPNIYRLAAGPRAPERWLVRLRLDGIDTPIGVYRDWTTALRERDAARRRHPSKLGRGCISVGSRTLQRPVRAYLPGGKCIGYFATRWAAENELKRRGFR